MKYLWNKKRIILDISLIVLLVTASYGAVLAAQWIYSNIITVTGSTPLLTLTSDAGSSPIVGEDFLLTAYLTLNGSPMTGKTIHFFENDVDIGTAITDMTGYAYFSWTVKLGAYNYKAGYEIV